LHLLSNAAGVEQKRDGVIQNAKTACLGVRLSPSIRVSGTEVPHREDVVAPDTSPNGVVRDEEGRIVDVKRFQRW